MTPGVGNVYLGGCVDPNLRIWLDANKMAQREITVEDVLDGITTEHADVPSGYIDNGPKEFNVRVYGEAYSPEEFSTLIIPNRVRGRLATARSVLAMWERLKTAWEMSGVSRRSATMPPVRRPQWDWAS